jgi:microcystin-dependent protein
MASPFISEIRLVAFTFAPKGWAFCNGQLLPINQNQALFSLLGTQYGGNGITNFALPNLQGRVPMHNGADGFGNSYFVGQSGGEVSHTLTLQELPQHTHTLQASNAAASVSSPANAVPAQPSGGIGAVYGPPITLKAPTMAPQAIGNTGGGQPHNNLQPYLVINFCIALQGIFPSQN